MGIEKKTAESEVTGIRRRVFVIIALALIVAIAASLTAVIASTLTRRLDYLSDDLSRYVSIQESAYKDAEIKHHLSSPATEELSERAMLDLIDYKTSSDKSRKTFGRIGVGDVLDIKRITLMQTDGTVLYQSEEYDLTEKTCKHTVGAEFLINGFKLSGANFAFEGAEIDCDLGNGTILAYVELPYNYPDLDLAGASVVLRVELFGFVNYDIPVLNDDFIENTLKISEKIKDFEGEKLSDKYISYLKAELEEEYRSRLDYLTEAIIWDKLLDSAEVKKLPRGDVKDRYNAYIAEIEEGYNSVGSGVAFADYACSYLGLSKGEDYKAYLRAEAEAAVSEKLIFYYIVRAENWLPSESELSALYNEAVSERLDVYLKYEVLCMPEHYATEAEYNAEVARHRADLISIYGEAYFKDEAHFRFGMAKLKESILQA